MSTGDWNAWFGGTPKHIIGGSPKPYVSTGTATTGAPTFTFTPSPSWPSMNVTGNPAGAMISFSTSKGDVLIRPNGEIEIPAGIAEDEALCQVWAQLQDLGRQSFEAAVRQEAARAVREQLPKLLPELNEYQRTFLPNAVAMAIETSKN
jgi:hypothetical protein